MADETSAAVREYFSRMAEIRGTGGATKETSYYSALESLLNSMGATLKPPVICNGQLRNQGAGSPDFGLYTKQQIQKGEPRPGQIPERGVVEVKGLAEETWQTTDSVQASKYFNHYRLVLITNYREFRLIGDGPMGGPVDLDRYTIASKEADFWSLASKPEQSARKHALHFAEFTRRVLMAKAPLSRAEDIAWFLASHAKDALGTLEEGAAEHLEPLRVALESALGIKFTGKEGEHFFRSTLVQTLFYGVFSAWVVHARQTAKPFDWRIAGYTLNVPMVKALFEEVARPTRLKELNLIEPLDRATEALNRVVTKDFFASFDTGVAVQHFYEPFLEAFDPELRKTMGVWYTPPEIVEYMVERVDRVLREELGKPDGLADKSVYVLDPACGTGAYVVQVLKRIEKTLRAKGDDALIGDDVADAARNRIFGFEIMPAPFVVAHWRVGNYLASDDVKAPLDPANQERAAIYLTNALTGWDPIESPKNKVAPLLFHEFEEERDAASEIKREVPILVFIGNPPYNAFAGTSPKEEAGLVEPYKQGLIEIWGIKKFNLDELYVRFLRIAERRIAKLGRGIVCYISSASYVDDPSFVVARQTLLGEFDRIWIDNLNGDSRETGKKTPEGSPDPSIFSTPFNRAGIRVGAAIGLFVRREKHINDGSVHFRNFWGKTKREELLSSLLSEKFDASYQKVVPEIFNKLSFRHRTIGDDYRSWPSLAEIAKEYKNGPIERRGNSLIRHVDESEILLQNVSAFLNPDVSNSEIEQLEPRFMSSSGEYDAIETRLALRGKVLPNPSKILPYPFKPFDNRIAYLDANLAPLFSRPAPDLLLSAKEANWYLISRDTADKTHEGPPFFASDRVVDYDFLSGHARHFPISLPPANSQSTSQVELALENTPFVWKPNLSNSTLAYCDSLELTDAESIWLHVLAVGYSPNYLREHASALEIGFPRIPFPNSRASLDHSATLGSRIAALLNVEVPIEGVTAGNVNPLFKTLGSITGTNLSITAGWGRLDKKNKVFPGKGQVNLRDWTSAELSEIQTGATVLGIAPARAIELLGPPLDVYLNSQNHWHGIPKNVWEYFIGGYQVIKKWLSYREQEILGRPLLKDEARHVTGTTRRIASLILMTDALEANYQECRNSPFPWPASA